MGFPVRSVKLAALTVSVVTTQCAAITPSKGASDGALKGAEGALKGASEGALKGAQGDASKDATKETTFAREALKALDTSDPMSGSRESGLLRKRATNTWGEPPYPVQIGGYQDQLQLAKSQGEIYTDDTENGNHIRKVLLDMHNYVRKLEAPAAQYMNKLIWDFHLEAYSRQWAIYLCQNPEASFFDHSPDVSTGIPTWPFRITTGENLYTSSMARARDDDYSDVVQKWYNERSDFDWSTGSARAGATQPVGHWKQLVRPQATSVGCTVVSGCHASGGAGSWKTYVACQYDYGNLSTLPYEPASSQGQQCQQCPSGMTCCEQGLCTGRISAESKGLDPHGPAKQSTEEWYGCANYKVADCSGTGAATFTQTLKNDPYNLEFNQCHCGRGPSPNNFADTVSHGYFWFRNHCYQLTTDQGDDLNDTNSITNLLSLDSETIPGASEMKNMTRGFEIYKDLEAQPMAKKKIPLPRTLPDSVRMEMAELPPIRGLAEDPSPPDQDDRPTIELSETKTSGKSSAGDISPHRP